MRSPTEPTRQFLARTPETKATVSSTRTVLPNRQQPPLAVLEQARPDDTIIPLVTRRSTFELEEVRRLPAVETGRVMGVACCSVCQAELEVCCPAGHGGADEVLQILTLSKSTPVPVEAPKAKRKGPPPPLICSCGAVVPRNVKGGRPPPHPKCENCKGKLAA